MFVILSSITDSPLYLNPFHISAVHVGDTTDTRVLMSCGVEYAVKERLEYAVELINAVRNNGERKS